MPNLQRRDFSRGWVPDADPVNGPVTALLRADNLVLNEENVPSLRLGSSKVNSSAFTDTDVHALYTFIVDGTKYRLAGAGSKVYLNGTALSTTFDGSGDIVLGSHMGHGLMARGTTKKKHDGTSLTNWGIAKPILPGTLAVIDPYTSTFATCNQGEAPGFTATLGAITATYPTGHDGTANGALEVTPDAGSGLFYVSKAMGSDTDFSTIAGYPEDPQDLFDMMVWVERPDHTEYITVQIGISSGSDPFKDDIYSFNFPIGTINFRRQSSSPTETVREKVAERLADESGGGDPEIQETIEVFQPDPNYRDMVPLNPSENPGWGHLTVTRGLFQRTGNTNGRNWSTVTGVRLVAKMAAGTTSVIRFDNIVMIGAAKVLALTGDFKFRFCWVKDHGNGWIEKSPPSDPTDKVSLKAQGARLTVAAATRQAKDPQADRIWIYAFGGFLDRYYRVMDTTVEPRPPAATAMRIDEFMKTADGSNLNTAAQRTRFSCVGFTIPVGNAQGSRNDPVTYDILANAVDALIENESLDVLSETPPDDIIDIEGPDDFRTFLLTETKLYPSKRNDPGLYNPLHAIRVGDETETAYWVKKTTGGKYVGTSKDIYVIEGDGAENPDETINYSRRNLNVGDPPISNAVAAHGNNILYLAASGWRMIVGDTTVPVPLNDVSTLYKGNTRHGVSAPNLTGGRFRAEVNKDQLVVITPEGASTTSSTVIHRFDFIKQKWYRHTYTPSWRSIYREIDGVLLAGDSSGFVWQLDTGTQDDSVDIPVVLWTIADSDGTPSNRKDAWDLLTRLDTDGDTATVALHLDGSGSAATSYSAVSSGMGLYKKALKTADDSGLAAFRQIQLRVTGSFSAFRWYDFDLAYRLRPRTRMFLDTGYLQVGSFDQGVVKEVVAFLDSPNNLTYNLYGDDGLLSGPHTLTVTANAARNYRLDFARGARGNGLRITLETSNSAGATEVGFEVYSLNVRLEGAGNQTEKGTITIVPDQQ